MGLRNLRPKTTADVIVAMAAIMAVGIIISYFIAMAGEPSSVWLWRDVLGVLP